MCYPHYLIRGIPNQTFVDEDGLVSAQLFYFNKPESVRSPGYREESINWHDDDGAITHALNQTKGDGTPQFTVGIALLCRSELDRIKNNPNVRNQFDYERNAIAGNPYHGNMLLRIDTPKKTIKKIAGQLALNVTQIIKREDYEGQ